MRFLKFLIIVAIILIANHFLKWTYVKNDENLSPLNDSVIAPASHAYGNMSPLKWIFLGENYRKEWSEPVKMPVFHLGTTKGGFVILRMGGGQQTKKLILLNKKDSLTWELRSVDKDVEHALPHYMTNTIVETIVQDGISASYPYGLLTIHDLSKAVGIPSSPTELYYVPDDSTLGIFRSLFARTVCILYADTIGNNKIIEGTDEMQKNLSAGNSKILQEQLLKSRLFDMLIGDWDRHNNQWDWMKIDSGNLNYYYPIPKDRDQAYFKAHGIISFLVKTFYMPHLSGFNLHPTRLKQLNHKSHQFDRNYLKDLDGKDWKRIILKFQHDLGDEDISKATKNLPPEVYKISGQEIQKKLRTRRDELLPNALEYYYFLSKEK